MFFLRTPKQIGKKLLPNDIDPPERRGMYFKEGLRINRLFILISRVVLYLESSGIASLGWRVHSLGLKHSAFRAGWSA